MRYSVTTVEVMGTLYMQLKKMEKYKSGQANRSFKIFSLVFQWSWTHFHWCRTYKGFWLWLKSCYHWCFLLSPVLLQRQKKIKKNTNKRREVHIPNPKNGLYNSLISKKMFSISVDHGSSTGEWQSRCVASKVF